MNRKLFTILLVAIFLIASVGFVSAADTSDDGKSSSHSISVSINWNGDSQSDRPGSVTVKLVKDGAVVDTATLTAGNSWSTTFTTSGDGSYSVQQAGDLSDYSVSTSGSASSGFVITNTLKEDVLGASEAENTLEETTTDELDEDTNTTDNDNPTDDEPELDNETNENETDDESDIDNETDDEPYIDNETDDESDIDNETDGGIYNETAPYAVTTYKNPTKNIQKDVKKVDKKVIKKENKKPNVTKTQLRNTGIPIICLVLVAFVVAFVPFTRKK